MEIINLQLNDNENIIYQYLWLAARAVIFRRNFIALNELFFKKTENKWPVLSSQEDKDKSKQYTELKIKNFKKLNQKFKNRIPQQNQSHSRRNL